MPDSNSATQAECERIQNLIEEIRACEQACGRTSGSVQLLAVSKRHPGSAIGRALQCGQRDFGENYAQELAEKCLEIGQEVAVWHFIGPLQSNKTTLVAKHAHWCHSVDRLKIAKRLSDQRHESMPPLQICIQVNVDDEDSKSGVSLEQLPALVKEVAELPRLKLRGLMCIPLASKDPEQQKASFSKLRQAKEQLQQQGYALDTLSMGMSNDYQVAIAEGATIIRVGTAIFGPRQ